MSAGLSEDEELLAAELAFGLIDGEERRAAEIRLDRDPNLAAALDRWTAYVAAMAVYPGEPPSPSVWNAIEARLPANDVASVGSRHATLRWWQAGTLAASAAALVLGVNALRKPETVTVRVPVLQQAVAPLVAVLAGKKGFVTVSFDPASGRLISAASGVDLGDRSPELWVIPADGKPRSMGVINAAAPSWFKIPNTASLAMAAGVTIAVSIEPAGGSPTGLPTGPVILTGKLKTI